MLMRVAGPKKNYTYALWGMASLFILANTISFLYILLRCTPISFAWNTTTPGGSCLPSRDLADVYYADTAVNILTDWFCALMYVLPFPSTLPNKLTSFFFLFFSSPLPLLYTLQLNLNAKLSVGFLLSLGILASLSACIRLKYTVNLNNSDDYLYSVADVMIWGYAENGVGFIVGCVSTLRPLFREMFSLGGGGHNHHNHSGGSGSGAYGYGYYDGGEDGGRLPRHGKVSYLREREEEELDLHPYYNNKNIRGGSGAATGRGVGKPSLTCQTKTSITCSQHPVSPPPPPPLSPRLPPTATTTTTTNPPPTTTTTTTTTTTAIGSKPTRKSSSESTSTCEEHILHSNHSLHSLHSTHSHHSDQEELHPHHQHQQQQQRFSGILSRVDSTHHHWRRGGDRADRTDRADGNGGAGAGMHGIQVQRSVHQTIA